MEYRGGTCDNSDIQDKEAGIYALFGFLALHDLTGEDQLARSGDRGRRLYRDVDLCLDVPGPYAMAEASV